ncbi:MAG TPA: hypothetical protein VGC97_18760 [Pyrinomonadaceae bacterium]|jgi:hypothetical protein
MDSFDIYLDDATRLVKVVVMGEVFQNEGERVVKTARETAAKHNFNVLYDIRAATITVPFANWYTLPRELEVFKTVTARQTKAAVLVSQTDKALEDYRFYETVADNLGFKLRVCFEETEALEWLSSNSTDIRP